jgi:hypothetical protein
MKYASADRNTFGDLLRMCCKLIEPFRPVEQRNPPPFAFVADDTRTIDVRLLEISFG